MAAAAAMPIGRVTVPRSNSATVVAMPNGVPARISIPTTMASAGPTPNGSALRLPPACEIA